ncbi:hypothetical protein [Aeromicrobium sp.]|uniref:hypothetical protein n=1 Tax=Aeromicrobium sp. TaxID=1871063 RepID=UPI0030C64B10
MRLPLGDPRDALALIARTPAMAEQVVLLLPRAIALLDSAEALLARVNALVDRIDTTRQSADRSIQRIDTTIDRADDAITRIDVTGNNADEAIERIDNTITHADGLVVRGAGLIGSIEPTVERGEKMFATFAPALDRLQPVVDRISRTIDPDEVEAVVRLTDHLPDLVHRLETDLLPMMDTLRNVGPDVHDLLDITRELNAMLGKVPGMGRVKKRVDEQQERNPVAGDEQRQAD